jgi:hypothetical protein
VCWRGRLDPSAERRPQNDTLLLNRTWDHSGLGWRGEYAEEAIR